jgi:hypothetical protein
MRTLSIMGCAALAACAPVVSENPSDTFFDNMTALCGGSYSGQVVSDQAVDADWIGSALVVGPVTCETDVIRMPLAVGEDASRTWVLTRNSDDLEFRHEHVEPDGTPSAVTQYGGYARDGGSPMRQDFPADELTKTNFSENGLTVSLPNVWTLTFDGQTLGYALARPATKTDPARDFRAVFDTQP